jgi:1-acyl-sn-glycerol-3-phosphate acyltransferase
MHHQPSGATPLVDAITTYLAHHHAPALDSVRTSLERTLNDSPGAEVRGLCGRLAIPGSDWDFYPGDPLARRLHHLIADQILEHPPALLGQEHVAAVADRQVVLFANHLSYSDANLVEFVFARAGARALADRLTVVAGPKVYLDVRRRFSSLCFGTIRTPQSSALSSAEAVMNPREVARAAQQAILAARRRLRAGDALLVFPEGTRSRTASMQRFRAAAARYLDDAGTWVLPLAITGTESLFPVGERALTSARLTVSVAPPIEAGVLELQCGGNRQLMMDTIGRAIARMLPESYRGVYGQELIG